MGSKAVHDLMTIFVLFAAFGVFCGFWLSIIGFAMTVIGLAVICAVMYSLLDGSSVAWLLISAVVALQLGYFIAIVLRALVVHVSRSPSANATDSKEDATTRIGQE